MLVGNVSNRDYYISLLSIKLYDVIDILKETIGSFKIASHQVDELRSSLLECLDKVSRSESKESSYRMIDYAAQIRYWADAGEIELDDIRIIFDTDVSHRLAQACSMLRVALDDLIDFDNQNDAILPLPAIPHERPAPIRVGVVDGGLTLIFSQTRTGSIDYPSANKIRESLRDTLAGLLENLPSGSNADQRYINACSRLLVHLSNPLEHSSIEALGLNYQLVDKMTKRLKEEIGGAAIDEIEHTLTGISVLLNQFQEWRDYLQELALTQLDATGGEGLIAQAAQLADDIETTDAPVDRKIAVRLREMIEPVTSGLINADTVAAPLVGSLTNIFSVLSRIAMESVVAAGSVAPSLPTLGASAILTSFAVGLLQKYCPTISRYQPFKFVIDVMAFFNKFYTQIKDSTKPS